MENTGYKIYLVFVVSWFLHLGGRIPVLGLIRFDLLLVTCLFCILFFLHTPQKQYVLLENQAGLNLKKLIYYIFFATLFAKWQGTVIKFGIPGFIKAAVFFFFTAIFVTSEKRLKTFIAIFIGCQTFRVLEPLFLHVTTGYWGGESYMGGEWLYRLAGAPSDSDINANGLAFVIVSTIPFYYFFSSISKKMKILFLLVFPLLIYALILTSSRSGILCFMLIIIGAFFKSKRKVLLCIVTISAILIIFPNLSPQQKDRYLSIIDKDTKNAESAQLRTEFNKEAFMVTLERPLFGFGLGTSFEANAHAGIKGIAHNLYIEVAQELGYIGLFFFILYIKSVFINFKESLSSFRQLYTENVSFMNQLINAMQVWLFMMIVSSMATYGFSTPTWYLFGGLSIVIKKIADNQLNDSKLEKSS